MVKKDYRKVAIQDIRTLKILLTTENPEEKTIDYIIEKKIHPDYEKRSSLGSSVKRLKKIGLIKGEKGTNDARSVIQNPNIDYLSRITYTYQTKFGLGLFEVLERVYPNDYRAIKNKLNNLAKEGKMNELLLENQKYTNEINQTYSTPEKEKELLAKLTNNPIQPILMKTIKKYWENWKTQEKNIKKLFISKSNTLEDLIVNFYFDLEIMSLGRLLKNFDRKEQKEMKNIQKILQNAGISYYYTMQNKKPEENLENLIANAIFIRENKEYQKEFIKQINKRMKKFGVNI